MVAMVVYGGGLGPVLRRRKERRKSFLILICDGVKGGWMKWEVWDESMGDLKTKSINPYPPLMPHVAGLHKSIGMCQMTLVVTRCRFSGLVRYP